MTCPYCHRPWHIIRTLLAAALIGAAYVGVAYLVDRADEPHQVRPSIFIPLNEVTHAAR